MKLKTICYVFSYLHLPTTQESQLPGSTESTFGECCDAQRSVVREAEMEDKGWVVPDH